MWVTIVVSNFHFIFLHSFVHSPVRCVLCFLVIYLLCLFIFALSFTFTFRWTKEYPANEHFAHVCICAHKREMIALNTFSVETANKTNRVSEHASIWCTVWRLYVCVFKSLKKSPLHFVYCINIYIVHKTQQAHRAMGIKILCVGEKKSIQLYLVLPNTKSKTHAHSIPLFSDAL